MKAGVRLASCDDMKRPHIARLSRALEILGIGSALARFSGR